MTLTDGTVYVGGYSQGLKEGYGKMVYANGTSMEGTFTEDLCNGSFKEYDAAGKLVKVTNYVNGLRR